MNDTELMAKIKAALGQQIRASIAGTPFPESFLAALTANESGGDVDAVRFEAAELGEFALVLAGKRPKYQGFDMGAIIRAISDQYSIANVALALVNLCSSWGPMQIMGWQRIRRNYPLSELINPAKHYAHAVEILFGFLAEWKIPVQLTTISSLPDGVYQELFRCWNTGSPTGITTDPDYVINGLSRMKIYEGLP